MKDSKKSILCMIDLSEASQKVLALAASDARDRHTDLVVVYTYRLKAQQTGDQKTSLKQRLEKDAYDRFEKIKSTVKELEGVSYTFSPEVGFEIDRLEAHIQDKGIQRIIVGKLADHGQEQSMEWTEFLKGLQIPIVLV